MELTERQRKIVEVAGEHRNRYLLPRRFQASIPPTETDLEYEACAGLVEAGYARWIGFWTNPAPGIRFTVPPSELLQPPY